MARLRLDFAGGLLSQTAQPTDVTLVSPSFQSLPVIATPDYMPVTLDPGGTPEIVHVVGHSASSASVNVTRAAEQGLANPAVVHDSGIAWIQAPTVADYDGRLLLATSSTLPANPDNGITVLETDTLQVVAYYNGQWMPVSGVPTGAVMAYAAAVAAHTDLTAPQGWLFCNGQSVTAAAYPNLYNLLHTGGNPYGVDASGNPKVPDLRDRRIAGAGGEYATGASGGRDTYSLGVSDLPNHTHPISDLSHAHGVYDPQHTHPGAYGNDNGGANGGWIAVASSPSSLGLAGGGVGQATFDAPANITVMAGATHIGIYGAYTGITATLGVSGWSAQTPVDMRAPYLAAPFIIRAT